LADAKLAAADVLKIDVCTSTSPATSISS